MKFAYDLARLVGYSVSQLPKCDISVISDLGTYIAPQRNDIVRAAIDGGFTHLLMIDGDMRFPKETLQELLKHDVDFVAANYPRRTIPPRFLARGFDGNDVLTHADSEGLERVATVGFGLVLMKVPMLKKLPFPWFDLGYKTIVTDGETDEQQHPFTGEDTYFCERARLANVDIWVDHTLSQYVRHVGFMEYNYIHALDAYEHLSRVTEAMTDGSRADN